MSRSCLKINKRGGQLGLDLVNLEGDNYFLYVKPLLALWENQDSYVLVKSRNRDEKEAIAYHPGQVLGTVELDGDHARLELYFGSVGQDIEYDVNSKTLKKIVSRHVYILPVTELNAVVAAFGVHRRNRSHFDEMTTVGRTLALFEKQ